MAAELTWAPVSQWAPGWRHVWLSDPPLHLLVCTESHEGKLRITHLVVSGESLDATQLISVPLGRIAQLMAITPPSPEPDDSPAPVPPDESEPAWFDERERRLRAEMDAEDDVEVATQSIYRRTERLFLSDALSTVAGLTPRPVPESEPWTTPSDREPLTRPPVGPGYDPEVFYRRVGEAYTAHILRTNRVAHAMADEAGVPLSTVRGWIREARRRGHIEPDRPKRV